MIRFVAGKFVCGFRCVRSCRSRAFTLVELLLGLAIFALIATTVYSLFFSGMRISERAEQSGDLYREARQSLQWMARELENMVSYDFGGSYPDKTAFIGEEGKITFVLPAAAGLRIVSYSLVPPERTEVYKVIVGPTHKKNVRVEARYEESPWQIYYLIREEKSFVNFLNDQDGEDAVEEVIATQVRQDGLRFFYGYLKDQESEEIVWESSWTESYIPASIRIEMDFVSNIPGQKSLSLTKDVLVPTGFLGVKEDGG